MFPGLLEKLQCEKQLEFIDLLKLVIFAHRYNKNDLFMMDPRIPFDVVRNPMYKFSNVSQNAFLDVSTYSFIVAWYASHADGQKFAL